MKPGRKTNWTKEEWVRYGNRVKRVRRELQKLVLDIQHVCKVRELDGLLKVERALDNWKCRVENLVVRDTGDRDFAMRVFYGEELTEHIDMELPA